MFKKTIKISAAEEAQRELNLFFGDLSKARIEEPARSLLKEQVSDALLQFERQLKIERVQAYSAQRMFEGDGYKVSIFVDTKPSVGLLERILRFLRLR